MVARPLMSEAGFTHCYHCTTLTTLLCYCYSRHGLSAQGSRLHFLFCLHILILADKKPAIWSSGNKFRALFIAVEYPVGWKLDPLKICVIQTIKLTEYKIKTNGFLLQIWDTTTNGQWLILFLWKIETSLTHFVDVIKMLHTDIWCRVYRTWVLVATSIEKFSIMYYLRWNVSLENLTELLFTSKEFLCPFEVIWSAW